MARIVKSVGLRVTVATVLALIAFAPFASLMRAQSTNATVGGQITDEQGSVVPEVDVVLTNVNTGISYSTKTNSSGIYSAPNLPPGIYRANVGKDSFKSIVKGDIELHVQDQASVNFQLQVGSVSETVTVEGGGGFVVNTTDAAVSTIVDRQFAENLPLNGRSFQSLLYLAPGVTPNMVSANGTLLGQGQFVVDGQRGDSNYWMVDGVGANIGMSVIIPGAALSGAIGATNAFGGTNSLVSVDALQEFRVQTSTYSPEFGRGMGGQISIQTRTGTNQFHGALFDYLRNAVLDAEDWFANANGLPKAGDIQNDFGGVVGGPIIRNKTFFFFSAEALRLRQPVTFLGTVPDAAARAAAVPAMQPYLNMYPLPPTGAVDACTGCGYVSYSTNYSNPGSADAYSLRIDHQLLKNLNVFARYNHAPSSFTQRGTGYIAANEPGTLTTITKTATLGATWLPFTNIVNDLRFNYSVSGEKSVISSDSYGGGQPFPATNLFAPGATFQNSSLTLHPSVGKSMFAQSGSNGSAYQHQTNLVDTLSVQKGAHGLKFGVDYRRLTPTADAPFEQLIVYFHSIPDMAAGNSELTLLFYNIPQTFVLQNLGVFGQDTWRMNSRLNVTYGLRWDVDYAPYTTRGLGFARLTGFSKTDLSNLAEGRVGVAPYDTRYDNIAPRVGVAYQALTNPDWGLVIRSGFGVSYGLADTEIFNNNFNSDYYPLGAFNSFGSRQSPVPFPTPPNLAALPVVQAPNIQNQQTLFGFDPHLNVPYALQWNVSLDQSLGKALSMSLSYIGAVDRRLLSSEFINNPNANYASANLVANAGSSNYQAFQAQFRRRLTHGLEALASYTWSHSIDTGSYAAYLSGSFANASQNRADSDFDVRHMFSAALTYNVPVLKSNAFTRAITNGWSTDNEIQIHSGSPVDIVDGNFSAINTVDSAIVIRPDRVPNQPLYLTAAQYPGGKAINPAAFADPPVDPVTGNPTRQGTLPRNALRGLGFAQWDFAVRREFPIYERVKLQFRAELFNVLNHPNFAPFDSYFQTGNVYFGRSTQMLNQFLGGNNAGNGQQNPLYTPGGPRSGELALKLIF